ncbi:putative phospholipase [Helianthus annuus]|nr:putative phospholipase [Helianthus annuus]
MSDSLLDDDDDDDDDDGDGDGDGDDDDDDDNDDDDVELSTTKQEHRELVENLSHMSDSLEKNSSCQSDMVCVQGYKVKRNNATILEAIFKKHGDIAANCVFKTSSTRTHFLEVVCEVVRRIQTDDMDEMVEDIECQVSDAEAANINVSWIRAHFEAFHKRKETSEKCSLLMEMESNTILVKEAAQMDLRERCAELMNAQERFKNAERCVRVLHLVEKNLHDNILESKSKLDSWVDHPVV